MSILERWLYLIGLRPNPSPRIYAIIESLRASLATLAEHEGRPKREPLPDLLTAGRNMEPSSTNCWN